MVERQFIRIDPLSGLDNCVLAKRWPIKSIDSNLYCATTEEIIKQMPRFYERITWNLLDYVL